MPFIVPIEQVPLVLLKHAQLFCVSRFRVDHHVTNTYMFTFEYSFFFSQTKKYSLLFSLSRKKKEKWEKRVGKTKQANNGPKGALIGGRYFLLVGDKMEIRKLFQNNYFNV